MVAAMEVHGMRGQRNLQITMLAFIDLEERVPAAHPLRTIKRLADEALVELSLTFDQMYAEGGRPSIPPERLLKASLLIALYSVRSERKDGEPPTTTDADSGNPSVDFHGEKRSNTTHRSTTDPDARLLRMGKG
jgi:hypothetical protein